MIRVPLLPLVAIAWGLHSPPAHAQWNEFRPPLSMSFPDGYHVVAEARADSRIVKTVPGPTEANLKGSFRNEAGVVFFLSDWSWDRRMSGESHYWILPRTRMPERSVPAPAPAGIEVFASPRETAFPRGFLILDRPRSGATTIKRVPGPVTADVKARTTHAGVTYFMSDWSWNQRQQGKAANWMRAIESEPAPPAPPTPPEPGFEVHEFTRDVVFENGYEVVDSLARDARILERHTKPALVTVAASGDRRDATGVFVSYFLSHAENARRKRGESPRWIRNPPVRLTPELLPRMRELAGDNTLPFSLERYSGRPWHFSIHLHAISPESGLAALREFGVESALTDIAPIFADAEFPLVWLREAARHLASRGRLDQAIATLRAHQVHRHELVRLYERSGEYEMVLSYARDALRFDARFLALLEAERGNHAEVEALLAPLIDDWAPRNDGMNASGPRINILREVARARWHQGKVSAARLTTDLWLDAYARNIANDILHPDFVDASQRVMEFDGDFEAVGAYFDLLGTITDPGSAARIVTGLKGLQLSVAASLQIRPSRHSDPELERIAAEMSRLEEEGRRRELAGESPDDQAEWRLSELRAELAMRRLAGTRASLGGNAEWERITAEIRRLESRDPNSYEIVRLREQRELLALDHLVEEGRFIATPAEVASRLEADEVLVDYFVVPPMTSGGRGRYGASLLDSRGEATLVRLASDEAIDSLVSDFLASMTAPDLSALDDLEAEFARLQERAFALIIEPLLPALTPAKRIVFCPDGTLAFLPLGSLRDSEGRLVQDRWDVSYVNAARDLLRDAPPGSPGRVALLVGDPDFERASLARTSAGVSSTTLTESNRSLLAEASRGISFAPLPGTGREVAQLSERLTDAGYRVESLTGTGATESALVDRETVPAFVHLATHGFFLPGLPTAHDEESSAMLLGGLALAGAQRTLDAWQQGTIPAPSSDGMLLASEAASLDFSGTRCVVLSACDTGVGRVRGGEGVEGLRSGLVLAGARHVLLTLWPVDDNATVAIMDSFYARLLEGTPPPLALAQTKRDFIRHYTESEGAYVAHRLVAPFVLTRSGIWTSE